jgi:hypothetical protein
MLPDMRTVSKPAKVMGRERGARRSEEERGRRIGEEGREGGREVGGVRWEVGGGRWEEED